MSAVINKEIQTYQEMSDKIKLRKVWDLVGMTPHSGQAPFVEVFDNDHTKNCYVLTLGRRTGKSASTAITALRELLVPFSNTILITPNYRNAKILFDETLKHVKALGLPIKALNKGSFTFELENGAKFGSYTETNVESALGSRASLIIFDETQSFSEGAVTEMLEQYLMPMLLDYSTNEYGILYGRVVFLGTPRGIGTTYHELFLKEKTEANWISFSAPSTANPLLPKEYINSMQNTLSDIAFKQEILAQWVSQGAGVFYAFSEEDNTYDPAELNLSGGDYIVGLDWGFSDSTALVLIYVDKSGNFYVDDCYSANNKTTEEHVENFRKVEARNKGNLLIRYGDPSASQQIHDLRMMYNYEVAKANNKIAASVSVLNELFSKTGVNKKPKLYINKNLTELITQIQLLRWKNPNKQVSNNGDPFVRSSSLGHHFDALMAMRYGIYSYWRETQMGIAIVA